MSRKATGYHCRLKTYFDETSYGIKNFVTKLNLFKNCSFSERKTFPDLYFQVILTSVTDDITVWGNCNNQITLTPSNMRRHKCFAL